MRYAGQSDQGKVREENEDSYFASDFMLAVADGMGGHQAGGLAGRIAVDVISKSITRPPGRPRATLAHGVAEANRAIRRRAAELGRGSMGTTLTVALAKGDRLWIAHVGDSRAYLLRDGQLRQLTQDHSLVADLVRNGQLSETEAREHPKRHIITRALGSDKTVRPDIFSVELNPNDRVLLCTDGLTGVMDDRGILVSARAPKPALACSKLVEAANAGGGPDNITVVIGDIGNEETALQKKGRWRLIGVVAAVFLAFALALGAANLWLNNNFYLVSLDRQVAVYKGLPGSAGPYELSRLESKTSIKIKDLPVYYKIRLNKGLVVGGRNRLSDTLSSLRKLAGEDNK